MNNCGISRWDDPKEINAQLKALTDQPIWEVTDEYYNNVILKYYDEKCTQSRAVYEESQKYIPGGVQHNLAFNKPFPMCMAKAEGAYLYDKDGNKYIDFLQAGGPTILGSLDDGMAAIIEDGVAKLPDRSSFAGSVCTTDRVVRNYVTKAGASLPEAVQVMTLSPARLMHIDDRKGSIAPGKDADIVLFDEGIDISLTMIGGKVVYRK